MTTDELMESPLAAIICEKEVFDVVFTNSPVGLCLMDITGKFLDVNEECARMFGYSRAELIGMTFQQITAKDDILADTKMLNMVLAGKISHYEMLKRFVTKGGDTFWARAFMQVVKGKDGEYHLLVKHIVPKTVVEEKEPQSIKLKDIVKNKIVLRFWALFVLFVIVDLFLSICGLVHLLVE